MQSHNGQKSKVVFRSKEAATGARRRTFSGGYVFRNFLGQPLDECVDLGVPARVIIDLTDPQGVVLDPTVRKGSAVKAGQVVARGSGPIASTQISSVSGTVQDVRPAGKAPGAITIESDGSAAWTPIETAGPEAENASPEKLESILWQSGISGMPTRFASAPIEAADVENVIINGVGADVYNPSAALIMGSRAADLVSTIRILKKIYPAAAFSVAFDTGARAIVGELRAAASPEEFTTHLLKPKYPQHMEEMLLPVVLGRPFPNGHRAINCGVLVLDLQTALQVHDAVTHGRPAIDRIVALAGPGFTRNVHVRVRVGTAVAELVESRLKRPDGFRLVENSLLTGKKIADASVTPVGPRTSTIIAVPEKEEEGFLPFASLGLRKDSFSFTFASRLLPIGREADTNLHGEGRSCLSCGFCESVCPARIHPGVLHRYVKKSIIDETILRYRITRCIDCNLCTYVCTSKIDLASLLLQGKTRLAAAGLRDPFPQVPPERLKGVAVKEPTP